MTDFTISEVALDLWEIIDACRHGDKNIFFNKLVKKTYKKAYRTAFMATGNYDYAKEAVQEAFIACYNKINSLCSVNNYDAWFYKILIRICWKIVSRERRKDTLNFTEIENNSSLIDASPDPLESGLDKETRREVLEAVNRLSRKLKEVVILYYYCDMSIKDIAWITGAFTGTVKSRLFKARKKLSVELAFLYSEPKEAPVK